MNSINKGLHCYEGKSDLYVPHGYMGTKTIKNEPNNIIQHKFQLKLCSAESEIYNPDYTRGNFGAVIRLLALERALGVFLGFHSETTDHKSSTNKILNKVHLYDIKKEVATGFSIYNKELVRQVFWQLQNVEWFKDSESLIILHNFLVAVSHTVFGCKTPSSPLSPQRNNKFYSKLLKDLNGQNELEQLDCFNQLSNIFKRGLLSKYPQIVKIYAAYKPWTTRTGLFVDINIYIGCNFNGINTVMSNLINTQRGFFCEIFSGGPFGLDLARFHDGGAFLIDDSFGIKPDNDILKIERHSYFLPEESCQAQERVDDGFSSSDDEDIIIRSRRPSVDATVKNENDPNAQNTPDRPDADAIFVNPNNTPIRRTTRKRPRTFSCELVNKTYGILELELKDNQSSCSDKCVPCKIRFHSLINLSQSRVRGSAKLF